MVDFVCVMDKCPQQNITYTFLGTLDRCECGGCGISLQPQNYRDDPEEVSTFP